MRDERGSGRRHAAVILTLAALALPAAARAQTDCTIPGQNLFVRNTLQDFYLWYRELPDPNTALFASPEAYLEAVRYRPLDASFSFITTEAASDAFYSDSQFIGFGIGLQFEGQRDAPDRGVPGQPGLRRAACAAATASWPSTACPWPTSSRAGEIGSRSGPARSASPRSSASGDLDGARREASMTKRLVTIPTVSRDARPRPGRAQGRLPPLPELRRALGGRPRRRLRAAARGGRDRAGAGPALQRRRPGLRGPAPGRPDRRRRHRRADLRALRAQRQELVPGHDAAASPRWPTP